MSYFIFPNIPTYVRLTLEFLSTIEVKARRMVKFRQNDYMPFRYFNTD